MKHENCTDYHTPRESAITRKLDIIFFIILSLRPLSATLTYYWIELTYTKKIFYKHGYRITIVSRPTRVCYQEKIWYALHPNLLLHVGTYTFDVGLLSYHPRLLQVAGNEVAILVTADSWDEKRWTSKSRHALGHVPGHTPKCMLQTAWISAFILRNKR